MVEVVRGGGVSSVPFVSNKEKHETKKQKKNKNKPALFTSTSTPAGKALMTSDESFNTSSCFVMSAFRC